MLIPATDTSAADWIIERWSATFTGQLVPSGFAACARIFHPAWRDGRRVTWAEIAAHFGTVAHPQMTWQGITRRGVMDTRAEPGLFDEGSGYDWLPTQLVGPVTHILGEHTTTPGHCWFGWWEGRTLGPEMEGPKFMIPGRAYHLFTGRLDDAVGFQAPPPMPLHWWGPSIWWPDDRAWFVASDTDLETTWIAGTRTLVADLVASPDLEAHEVSSETDFAHRRDDRNSER